MGNTIWHHSSLWISSRMFSLHFPERLFCTFLSSQFPSSSHPITSLGRAQPHSQWETQSVIRSYEVVPSISCLPRSAQTGTLRIEANAWENDVGWGVKQKASSQPMTRRSEGPTAPAYTPRAGKCSSAVPRKKVRNGISECPPCTATIALRPVLLALLTALWVCWQSCPPWHALWFLPLLSLRQLFLRCFLMAQSVNAASTQFSFVLSLSLSNHAGAHGMGRYPGKESQ